MIRHGHYYVYIVECATGTYYTGFTKDVENRLKLHNNGSGAKYLRGKGPVQLVYVREYLYYKNACHAERDLKKLTRKKKEELIRSYARILGVRSEVREGLL